MNKSSFISLNAIVNRVVSVLFGLDYTKTTYTKQANTRALQKSDNRPEGISYIGNLEAVNHPATNSNYVITTGFFNSIDTVKNIIDNSFYLGVGSGRVSDQKKRRFSYQEFISWLDAIYDKFQTDSTLQSGFIRSFAKPANSAPKEDPSACMLDFTIFNDLSFYYKEIKYPLAKDYSYKIYNQGFYLIDICDLSFVLRYSPKFHHSLVFTLCLDKSHTEFIRIQFSFNNKNNLCIDSSDKLEFYVNNRFLESKQVELDSRIRLYNGKYDLSLFQQPDTLDEVFEEIDKRRKDVLVKKEIWLVIGNAFSNGHFTKQLKSISNAEDESKQAYQLIETWLSTLSSHDVDLKIFVSH